MAADSDRSLPGWLRRHCSMASMSEGANTICFRTSLRSLSVFIVCNLHIKVDFCKGLG